MIPPNSPSDPGPQRTYTRTEQFEVIDGNFAAKATAAAPTKS